jgi:hypothetical protein
MLLGVMLCLTHKISDRLLYRSYMALNHLAAAIIAFRNVPLTINIIYG